jgi:hypothetical protein
MEEVKALVSSIGVLPMRRPTYRDGVEWVAFNDEPGDLAVEDVAGYLSTILVADLFGVDRRKVAADVVLVRKVARQEAEAEEAVAAHEAAIEAARPDGN